jgi:hypothetical protein
MNTSDNLEPKPDSHFHQHRDKEYVTNYFPEIYGTVKNGPTCNIVISLVKFRRSNSTIGMYIDLRMNSYSVERNKYFSSKKGITVPTKILLGVINALNSLPQNPPEDLPEVGNKIIAKFEKYKNIHLAVSVTNVHGEPKLDIREWVNDVLHSYEGFTYKGVRFSYDLIPQVSAVLMTIYDKITPVDKSN